MIDKTYLNELIHTHGATSSVPLLKYQERYSRYPQTMRRSIRSPDFRITLVTVQPFSSFHTRRKEIKEHSLVRQEVLIGEILSVEMMGFEQVHGEW